MLAPRLVQRLAKQQVILLPDWSTATSVTAGTVWALLLMDLLWIWLAACPVLETAVKYAEPATDFRCSLHKVVSQYILPLRYLPPFRCRLSEHTFTRVVTLKLVQDVPWLVPQLRPRP